MKISFQNIEMNNDAQAVNSLNKKADYGNADTGKYAAGTGNVKNGIRLDMNNFKKGIFAEAGKMNGKSISELQAEAGAIDSGVDKNFRVVMSNTLSKEDYAKAQKEGYDYNVMDSDDVVTIQDKVKAELAMSGVIIVGYNDDMDGDVLSEAVGSETLARGIKGVESKKASGSNDISDKPADIATGVYAESNLPMTDENIAALEKAWRLASELRQPTEGNLAYMVENELRPTVWNFYLAMNSGAVQNMPGGYGASDGVNSMILPGVSGENTYDKNDTIVRQIENIINDAGMNTEAAYTSAMADAQWLLRNNLPVTVESIKNLKDIKSVEFPVSIENFVASAAAAVSEGKDPIYADLTKSESIYTMAANLELKYFSDELWEQTAGDITARRQLEEIRLSMTAEVNVKLLQSDFSIDTKPMEQLIDALKAAELKVAERYFDKYTGSEEEAISSYRLMNETNRVVQEISSLPAATLGMYSARNADTVTLREFHTEGTVLRDTYTRAGESYEALMTAPRADLGDRISKAFAGIDSLLGSLNIEVSDSNLRAARILGYNNMEITNENIDKVVYADRMVQSVVSKMTPASVLQMIREGVNPLENDFEKLSKYFADMNKEEYKEEAKDYSDFLYGLDMQDAITAEERESFIGIYRMLHQIEKADGAAIGSVVNERAELNFDSLMSAVRSNRFKGVDLKIDNDFGMTEVSYNSVNSITNQIATAFIGNRQNVELEQLRSAAYTGADVTEMLEQYSIPASAENMSAMESLISSNDNLFENILSYASKYDKGNDDKRKTELTNVVEELTDSIGADGFDEKIEQLREEMDYLTKELTFSADEYIDVKSLSLIHLQLGMVGRINAKAEESGKEEFLVPYDNGAGIGKAHITFKRGEAGAAKLDIKAQMAEGVAELHMSLNDDRLEGYFVGNTKDELQKMKDISDILIESLKEDKILGDLKVEQIPVFTRDGEGTGNLLSDTKYQSKDADGLHSEGTEKRVLLQMTKLFLQSVRKA